MDEEWKCTDMVEVMLCCNDANGNLDRLTQIQVGEPGRLDLEGDLMDGEEIEIYPIHNKRNRLIGWGVDISENGFYVAESWETHVGNIYWDKITLHCNEAADLVNYLFKQQHWNWTCIAKSLQGPVKSGTLTGSQLAGNV